MKCYSVLPPLPAIQTGNKDGGRFIGRPRLEFVIGTLPLVTPAALVRVGRPGLVALENLLFPHKVLVGEFGPVLGKHFIGRHGRNVLQGEFALLAALQEAPILDRRGRVEIP